LTLGPGDLGLGVDLHGVGVCANIRLLLLTFGPVSNLRAFVDSAHDIFVCDQCFNSLKSLTVSQAKSDQILNNLKNSASSDFKSLTSKLQYQTEKTCTNIRLLLLTFGVSLSVNSFSFGHAS
jgi:hypothetical protein